MPTKPKLNKADDFSCLQRMYAEEFVEVAAIAAHFRVNVRTIYSYLKKWGISRPTGRRKALFEEDLRKLYLVDGLSVRAIAKLKSCGKETVRLYLINYGIPLRDQKLSRVGKKHTAASKKKIGARYYPTGKDHPLHGVQRFGSSNPCWRGGCRSLNVGVRALQRYVDWRTAVFSRDNFTCVLCGDSSGGNLHADHIIPLCHLLRKYGIRSTAEADLLDDLWDVSNGRTLCKACHKTTDTFGAKAASYVDDDSDSFWVD